MKLYREYSKSSISMSQDLRFRNVLKKLFLDNSIYYLVESGTYLGTGSTKTISESFPPEKLPKKYFTIEASYNFYKQALKNLEKFNFVEVIWGRSVSKKQALEFIRKDEAILHHEKYPEIYIDDIENPVKFYETEIRGYLNTRQTLKSRLKNFFSGPPEDLLTNFLNKYKNDNPFIILDSAGGIGYLEYQTVKEIMREKSYWLLLDDIHHLKHFRSFADVKHDSNFALIDFSLEDGWMLAKHNCL